MADTGHLAIFNAAAHLAGGRLTIDLAALASNYRTLAKLSAPAEAAAVVKANAYGLGIDRVVPVLLAAGCKDGRVFLVTPSGEMAGQAARPGRLQDLAVVRNAADGTRSDAVVVVSADPNEVWMLAAP